MKSWIRCWNLKFKEHLNFEKNSYISELFTETLISFWANLSFSDEFNSTKEK